MTSGVADLGGNLVKAGGFAERAAAAGAQLVLFPELMSTGYTYRESLWDAGEPQGGPTERWMMETSGRLGLWLASTWLEASGDDFFNTLTLTRPDGTVAGRSRKQTPACFEAWFFRGEPSAHCVDTELGRIGVGICMDNQMGWLPRVLQRESVDLLLQPHAWSLPVAPWATMTQKVIDRDHEVQRNVAPHYAKLLGVPAIFTNQTGLWEPTSPGRWPKPPPSHFPGHSTIADSDGSVRAQAEGDEDVIVAEVHLDPARKVKTPMPTGRWTFPGPPLRGVVQMAALWGHWAYRRNEARRELARAISARPQLQPAAPAQSDTDAAA